MEESKRKGNTKLLIVGFLFLVGIIGVVGYTYSFFAVNTTNNTSITGSAAALSLTVTVTKESPTSVTGGLIPQLDAYITSAVTGRNGSCVDDNNNPVCEVYKINVKNNSGVTVNVDGVVELDAGDNPNLKWARISGLDTPTVTGNIKTHQETTLTMNETYAGLAEKDYYIVVWISETGLGQNDTGVFDGVVTFYDAEPTTAASTTLYSLGIVPKKDELTTFTTTSKLDGTTGVYKAEDDLGTSYYWRGNVTNNYVKFAYYLSDAYQVYDTSTGLTTYTYASTCTSEGSIICTKIASAGDDMYWRIVRINGDGTIRLVYDGTSAFANGDTAKTYTNNSIGYTQYNTSYNDNAYVGYMYGTAGSDNYDDTHANTNNSVLKSTIDAWYEEYLKTDYSSYIADAIYCNDRTRVTDETINNVVGATGEGFGTYVTYYSLYNRMTITEDGNLSSLSPTLKCGQENDRFTQNPTVGIVTGNDKLTYPVATLTVDEVTFAGGYLYMGDTYVNDESYLYNANYAYLTMSPGYFDGGYANAFNVYYGSFNSNLVNDVDGGARPALSLSSTAITGGSGTITDPFTVPSSKGQK